MDINTLAVLIAMLVCLIGGGIVLNFQIKMSERKDRAQDVEKMEAPETVASQKEAA